MERANLYFKSNTNGEKKEFETKSFYKCIDNKHNLKYFDIGQNNERIKTTIIYDHDSVIITRECDYTTKIQLNRFSKSKLVVSSKEGTLEFDVKIKFMNLSLGRLYFKYQMISNKEVLSEVEIDIKYSIIMNN